MRAQLNATLPSRYTAAADAYIWMHEPTAEVRIGYRPDAYLIDEVPGAAGGPRTATMTPPATALLHAFRREGEKYLKVVDTDSNVVVTVVEILSPANKRRGADRDAYLVKRLDYLNAGLNLVELDLLRGGERVPIDEPTQAITDYCATVCRAEDAPRVELWPFSLRDPMPSIPIPLPGRQGEPTLDLRNCLDRAYEEGRYRRRAKYDLEPEPPLSESDQKWAEIIVAKLEREHI
jgi:hypothetical protein